MKTGQETFNLIIRGLEHGGGLYVQGMDVVLCCSSGFSVTHLLQPGLGYIHYCVFSNPDPSGVGVI